MAKELIEIDGIAYALPSTDPAAGRIPDVSPMARQVLRKTAIQNIVIDLDHGGYHVLQHNI